MSFFARIRTTQERRQWPIVEELMREYPEFRSRRRRSISALPNAWDDEVVGPVPFRSWKWWRKTQYKE